jgi:hypothetical protein
MVAGFVVPLGSIRADPARGVEYSGARLLDVLMRLASRNLEIET